MSVWWQLRSHFAVLPDTQTHKCNLFKTLLKTSLITEETFLLMTEECFLRWTGTLLRVTATPLTSLSALFISANGEWARPVWGACGSACRRRVGGVPHSFSVCGRLMSSQISHLPPTGPGRQTQPWRHVNLLTFTTWPRLVLFPRTTSRTKSNCVQLNLNL